MLLSLTDFIGRFHPVLVHLPIGILLLACFFQWFTLKKKFSILAPAIPVMVFWGMLGAITSAISGYMLSLSGDYEGGLVQLHQWAGIATAILSLILYIMHRFSVSAFKTRWMSAAIIVLIVITGHWGGSLTHGSDYLTKGLNNDADNAVAIPPIPNIDEAVVYNDMVKPLLQARCYSCHGPNKQKGKLRLDEEQYIIKGGKNGKAVDPGRADESEMIARLLLPLSNEDHMPPKEKPQLTKNEIELLQWWVNGGADFTKKTKDLAQTTQMKQVLLSFQAGAQTDVEDREDLPSTPVERGDEKTIDRLKKAGVMVLPIAQNSNYLSVSFFTAEAGADSLVKLLLPLKKQIIRLKLDHAAITDSALQHISNLTALSRLQLSNTDITDKGLMNLLTLQQLQSLNLVGTKVTAHGLTQLGSLKKLKHLYLYRTGVNSSDWPLLQKTFPGSLIDSGKYTVPTLATDTTEIKYKL